MPLSNQRGQSLIEYLLLTALVAIAAMGIVRLMGHSVSARLADVTNAIQGHKAGRVQVERVEENDYVKRDMSDFMRGSVKRKSNSGSSDSEPE